MEFARVCRQVIGIINLRKLTNRQFENSKQLSKTVDNRLFRSKTVYFFREANPANRKSLLIVTHFYSFLPIPTHCYSWSGLRVHDKAGFSKKLIILKCVKNSILQKVLAFVVLDIGFTQKGTGGCEKIPFPFIPFYSLLLPFGGWQF